MINFIKLVFNHLKGRKYYKDEIAKYGKAHVASVKDSKIISEDDPVYLTAHRGFSGIAPENTLPSFELACQKDFFAIECDVHLTKDLKWVICHNKTIDKTTNGEGKICNYTFDEIRKFDITFGNNIDKYKNLKLPSLDEYLDICKKYNATPEIEVKGGRGSEKLTEIIDKLKEKGLLEKAIIISFDWKIIAKLKEYSPNTEYWFLSEFVDDWGIKMCKKYGFRYALSASTSDKQIKKAIKENVGVSIWTVDRLERMEELYKLGVRYFTSNFITY